MNDVSAPFTQLNDLLTYKNGTRMKSRSEWETRRREINDLIIELEYGGMPPSPRNVDVETLHTTIARNFDEAVFETIRMTIQEKNSSFSFTMQILSPSGDAKFPVILNGDGCWKYATEEILLELLAHGYAFAQFNRVELAADNYKQERHGGLYSIYPESTFGAISAWAWGYHRCVDALERVERADHAKIAVVGHSRGGKASLLAGATDTRIALTSANDSGCGGAGCFQIQSPGSETLKDILKSVPYWFGPELKNYISKETDLPFDQHFLKAMVAPRPLLTTEALDDLWANPEGTYQTHLAAKTVFDFLGAPENIAVWQRPGKHCHSIEDWRAFFDFANRVFKRR